MRFELPVLVACRRQCEGRNIYRRRQQSHAPTRASMRPGRVFILNFKYTRREIPRHLVVSISLYFSLVPSVSSGRRSFSSKSGVSTGRLENAVERILTTIFKNLSLWNLLTTTNTLLLDIIHQ